MSVKYVTAELRRLVVARAEGLCEYCLIAEEDTFYGCEVDHVISEKHGGPTQEDNLAYACVFCNQAKGSDVGSIHWESGQFVRFFNPRTDRWADHFVLTGGNGSRAERRSVPSPRGSWTSTPASGSWNGGLSRRWAGIPTPQPGAACERNQHPPNRTSPSAVPIWSEPPHTPTGPALERCPTAGRRRWS